MEGPRPGGTALLITVTPTPDDIEMNPGLVFNNFGCQGFIVSVKKPRSTFENIENNIRMTMERFNFRKYLFIPVNDAEEDMLELFESPALEYVADVDVIMEDNSTENGNLIYNIITHKYYDSEGHTDIVVLDEWLLGGWGTPFLAFNAPIWIVFAITIVLSIVTLYSALTWSNKRYLRLENSNLSKYFIKTILLTEAMYLNQSVTNIPKNFSARLVFSMILMMSLVLGVIYDSGLASSMMIPRYSGVIRTPQDMIENSIPWGATEDAWISSIEGSESPIHKSIVKLFVVEGEVKLSERNIDKKFAFAIERLQGGNFAVGSYITEDGAKIRRILNEDLYFDYMAFYMKKSSILLPYLDNIILKVAQAGLLEVWEYDAVSRYSDTRIQKIIKDSVHSQKPAPNRLKFREQLMEVTAL
ncbi:hypothetical protein Trydic_g23973 [Trypoxylus dichotomus]